MNLERRRIFLRVLAKSSRIDEAVKYSNLGVNIKYMKCTYPPDVMLIYNAYLSND